MWTFSILFFLTVGLVPLAYAEVGYDYDITQLGPKIFKWTSHYPRVDNNGQWVNFVWSDDGNIIHFKSAQFSYQFDKNDCSFRLLNPQTNDASIEKYEKSLIVGGVPTTLSKCNITNINPTADGLQIIMTETAPDTELKTIYDLSATGFGEWTYEITNTNMLAVKQYSINESCLNCAVEKREGDIIQLGDYFLDTKNMTHKTLKTVEESKDLTLYYEYKPITFFEKAVIDPVFGYASGTLYGVKRDVTASSSCNSAVYSISSGAGNGFASIPQDTATTACYRMVPEWDISSLPMGIDVSDVTVRYDITTISTPRNCDWVEMEVAQPSVAAAIQTWNDAGNGTIYVSSSSQCTTVANDKVIDLGADAEADIEEARLAGRGWWSVAAKLDDEVRNSVEHFSRFNVGTGQAMELQVTYVVPPPILVTSTFDLTNVGDIGELSGVMTISNSSWANLTSIKLIINGTTINTNSTGQNKTSQYQTASINWGTFYYQIPTDDVYNFTIQATVQNSSHTINTSFIDFISREYGPNYFTAVVPSQGDVNYTFIDNVFKINRDKGGALFQVECTIRDWAAAFFNVTEGTWYNQTDVAYFTQLLPKTSDYYASCYNDDALFLNVLLPSNFSSFVVPGLFMFDALGGFLGVPAVLLFVLAIFSWGSGRNFPIVLVIGLSAIGIVGAMGLLVMSGEMWGLIIVMGGIGIFGIRKFF